MKKQTFGQKIAFIFAMISYFSAVVCGYFTYAKGAELGMDHPVPASFMAAIVFFVGAGIVLHVIGTANLPSLKIDTKQNNQ